MRLRDKKAVVTGAGQGIGRAIAEKMVREGADVVVAEMNCDSGPKTAKELEALGRSSLWMKVDVADREQVQRTDEGAIR